jgi:hypothetical protein
MNNFSSNIFPCTASFWRKLMRMMSSAQDDIVCSSLGLNELKGDVAVGFLHTSILYGRMWLLFYVFTVVLYEKFFQTNFLDNIDHVMHFYQPR